MADKETKSTMREFAANDQADYYSGITCIKVNGKNAYELKGKFLDDLHNNAFDGTNGEEAVKHIKYFLRIVDPIDLPNVRILQNSQENKNDTRDLNKHTKDRKFALNSVLKKHKSSQLMRLPAWQSVCSQSHPKVKIDHPMIRRFEGTRSKAKGAYEQT
ncbi:hypothetical protein Tco_0890353 [Tanacetum coccineum]|uniref:Uncharacterized protein n=1 Tax=Tanacetum coccineum TaxID=301880 RepID=A0ABQ5C365_9ASTR